VERHRLDALQQEQHQLIVGERLQAPHRILVDVSILETGFQKGLRPFSEQRSDSVDEDGVRVVAAGQGLLQKQWRRGIATVFLVLGAQRLQAGEGWELFGSSPSHVASSRCAFGVLGSIAEATVEGEDWSIGRDFLFDVSEVKGCQQQAPEGENFVWEILDASEFGHCGESTMENESV
jgi:hypothetical protein